MALPNDKESLKERIQIVAEAWLNGKTKTEAYLSAGYSSATPGNASLFFRDHKAEIDTHVFSRMKEGVPTAINVLMDIMVNGKSETARIKAVMELLDRVGYTTINRIEITNKEVSDLENKQLEQELNSLIEKAGKLRLVGGKDA